MTSEKRPPSSRFDSDLGLFVEEVTADLVRFEHAAASGCAHDHVAVRRESRFPGRDAYADIQVTAPDAPPLFVEVKLRYTGREIVRRIGHKYGPKTPTAASGERLAVIVCRSDHENWAAVEAELRSAIRKSLALEIWDEPELIARLRNTFADDITELTRESLLEVRQAIERAYWRFAFDGNFADHPNPSVLLWHLSPWELRRLHTEKGLAPKQILAPRLYEQIVVLMADLCSFSSFVRDTRDSQLIRRKLTGFYSYTRYAVLNAGGFVYQFVGDEIVALFGLHESPEVAAKKALACANTLFDIGHSVADAWQRTLDRVQPSHGVHIGIAAGDLNLLQLRPFSSAHIGFIGESLNIAARLLGEAKADEAVMSNGVYRLLDPESRENLEELAPIEAKNVGRITAWKMKRA